MSDRGALEVFNFQGAPVRHVIINGEPWWVLVDVCAVLGIANSRNVAARLPADEVSTATVDTYVATVVSEAGLYRVVIRSDKPAAEPFLRWITHEVLPSIRRTGQYGASPALTDDQIVHQALQITQHRVAELEDTVAELAPKAERYDHLVDEVGLVSMGQAARILYADGTDTGRRRLFDFIDTLGWLMWERDAVGGRHRVGTQAAQNRGLIAHRLEDVPLGDTGRVMPVNQPFLTPRGFNAVRDEMRGRPPGGRLARPGAGTGETTT